MLDLQETAASIHTKEEKFRRFPELIEQVRSLEVHPSEHIGVGL